ncbi:MAG: hypothetical protein ACI8TQ_000479 [Planctomycetota bacterium]|jgi:hypothetical protein
MKKASRLNGSLLASLCLPVFLSGIARADVVTEVAKFLPDDGSPNAGFGSDIAINGKTALIGAYRDEENGLKAGAAYLFDLETGTQIVKLLPDDGEKSDEFGASVGLTRTTAIVGAMRDNNSNGKGAGAAYLFDSTTGVQLAKLTPDDGHMAHNFGSDVAISGTTAIVGAWRDGDNGIYSGAAYLFDTTTGLQLAKLLPDDGEDYLYFGLDVAIAGNRAIVGASGYQYNNYFTGAAYLFDVTTGQQLKKILPFNLMSGARLGSTLAMGPKVAIIGAPSPFQGSDYAILVDSVTGDIRDYLSPGSGTLVTHFSRSVAIDGRYAVLGAYSNLGGIKMGTSYVFDTTTGFQQEQFYSSDIAVEDYFGGPVAISGSTVLAASTGDGDNGFQSGSAYQFEIDVPPLLTRDVESISLSAGGSQQLNITASYEASKWYYIMLGSTSGTTPSYSLGNGFDIPLKFDRYLGLTQTMSNLPIFSKFYGALDNAGRATATLNIPPGSNSFLAGLTLHHAYFAGTFLGGVSLVSNAVSVTFVP